jgi:hypothetical protein
MHGVAPEPLAQQITTPTGVPARASETIVICCARRSAIRPARRRQSCAMRGLLAAQAASNRRM